MKTVKEVSTISGVSIRTLHYYDSIGLLKPTQVTESGYRLYDDTALEKLQMILLFRELQFPLKEIADIMNSSDYNKNEALRQQIELLQLRKERLENLITLARGIKMTGVKALDFSAFDTGKIDEYVTQAKILWGKTDSYKEFEDKTKYQTKEEAEAAANELMGIFKEIGELKTLSPDDEQVQAQIEKLRQFLTDNYYTCTPKILNGLGKMYADGGSFTENIDKAGGEGTAEFASKAIAIYCNNDKG